MSRPMISVIVPVYKVEDYICRCLDSLVAQTYQNLEIILVDDGSPDSSGAICEKYAARDKRIKVIHKENGGLSSARNAALDVATGAYIAFLDSDDWLDVNTYAHAMEMLLSKRVDVVCIEGVTTDGQRDLERWFRQYPTGTVHSAEKIIKEMLLDKMGSQVVRGIYARKCWDGVRFPLGRRYEDIPTTYRAYVRAETVGFISEPYYKYYMNDEGISADRSPVNTYHIYLGFREQYEYAAEHYSDIVGKCCAKAAHYAVSTLFNYYGFLDKIPADTEANVEEFLQSNRKLILRNASHILRTRRLALYAYYLAPRLTKVLFQKMGDILSKRGQR